MKKFVCLLLILALAIPAAALAEEIDLSSYSVNALLELRNRIDLEIKNRSLEAQGKQKIEYWDFGTVSACYQDFEVFTNNGKNYLAVKFSWINKQDEPATYTFEITVEAYQNGIQLDTAYVYGYETDSLKKVLPGYEGKGVELFELPNTTDDIVVYFGALFDFSGEYPAKSVIITTK